MATLIKSFNNVIANKGTENEFLFSAVDIFRGRHKDAHSNDRATYSIMKKEGAHYYGNTFKTKAQVNFHLKSLGLKI